MTATLTLGDAARIVRDDRLIAKIEERPSGCWQWIGYTNAQGYGRLTRGGRQFQAYRFVYELLVAPIPHGLTIDHLCRNRECGRRSTAAWYEKQRQKRVAA